VKTPRPRPANGPAPRGELADLRARLAAAEDTLRAIRTGEVDTVMVPGKAGTQVFTLDGAEHIYRELIESMNEGALTLTANKTILYANQCFARMVKSPLEQVMGSSLRRFLSAADRAAIKTFLKSGGRAGAKIQVRLLAGDASMVPVRLSIRRLPGKARNRAAIGMVLTDMSESLRQEERLRALTQRVVLAQENERGRVARELHDNITQLLCGILVRSQTLADQLPEANGPAKATAVVIRDLLGETAEEVERISRNLRPGVLEQLGLVAVLRAAGTTFTKRTGVALKLTCTPPTLRLADDIELTLYRILQEALNNVVLHARARQVTVQLTRQKDLVQLVIHDDGVGFDPEHQPARRKKSDRLSLLGMRERASYVGGSLSIKSAPGNGTTITVQIPLSPATKQKNPARAVNNQFKPA